MYTIARGPLDDTDTIQAVPEPYNPGELNWG